MRERIKAAKKAAAEKGLVLLDPTPHTCRAIKKTGARCKKLAMLGGYVCETHGGSAPQVKEKAKQRLTAMAIPTLKRMEILAHQNEHLPTALGAATHLLNRALGAVGKDADEKDKRPQVRIAIAVGGIPLQNTTTTVIEAPAELPPGDPPPDDDDEDPVVTDDDEDG